MSEITPDKILTIIKPLMKKSDIVIAQHK